MGSLEISVDASGKTTETRPFPTIAGEQLLALEAIAKQFAFHPMSYHGSAIPFVSVLGVCSDSEVGTVPCAPKLNDLGGVSDPIPQRLRLPGCEEPQSWSKCKLPVVMNRRKLSWKPPVYPVEAKLARVTGTVVVRIIVSSSGDVVSTRVLGGPPMLYGSAVTSLKTWKFRPLTWNGTPVEVELNEVINYTLAD